MIQFRFKNKYILKTIAITCCCFFLFSCGNDKITNKEIIQETVKAVKETPKSNDFSERLKANQAVTKVQFKNGLPKQLENFKRTKFT